MPEISVIVPVYNGEDTLARCIASVLEQTYIDFELIIVNDGSEDGSLEIAEALARNDSRIIIINQDNQGLGAARNTGVRHAQGRYVAFLDCDDQFKPEMLQSMFEALVISDASIANCEIDNLSFAKNGSIKYFHSFELPQGMKEVSGRMAALMCMNGIGAGALNCAVTKVIKKSLFEDYDIWFPEDFRYVEDIPTSIRLFLVSETVVFVHEPLYNYIHTKDSLTTSKSSLKKAFDVAADVRDVLNFVSQRKIDIPVDNFVIGMIYPIEKNVCRSPVPETIEETESLEILKEDLRAWRKRYKPDYDVENLSVVQKVKLFVSYRDMVKLADGFINTFSWIPFVRFFL